MNADVAFWLLIGSLLFTLLAASGARSLSDFSLHELAELCRRRSSGILSDVLRLHDRVALAAENLQLLATAVLIGSACFWLWRRQQAEPPLSAPLMVLWMLVAAVVLLIVTSWAPRSVARLWAEPLILYTWRWWRAVDVVMAPMVGCAEIVDGVLHRLAGREREESTEETLEDEIRTIVSEGYREGLLEDDAREMIERIIDLGDADVSEIMTPRTDMVTMHVQLSLDEALDFAIKSAHSRIPVYDKNRDDIVGVLYIKDLLPELAKPPEARPTTVVPLLRPPVFVPETKPVDALLGEFQLTRTHLAVVLDEYGGVSGLVTIEDVLEEIVGEIVDEFDEDIIEGIKRIDERTCEALARVHVDEVNEQLGLDLPDDGDFDTIGGYVFSELGHVPTKGEQLVRDKVRITVLDATRRRIERVRIELVDGANQGVQ